MIDAKSIIVTKDASSMGKIDVRWEKSSSSFVIDCKTELNFDFSFNLREILGILDLNTLGRN